MAAPTSTDHSLRSLRIFLVENHADSREYIQMYLESLGHVVSSDDTMEGALAALPQAGYDVLVD